MHSASVASPQSQSVTTALRSLIDQLDALGPKPSIAGIQRALEQAHLTQADLAHFVRTDTRRYHRGRVAWRSSFEVLVMTWLPGQCSPPHDHGGSICAMRIMAGRALERTWHVAEDGLADPCMDETFDTGRTVAGDDASVHSVHNPATDGPPMVTLHVYAPPLREFRRFMPRGSVEAPPVNPPRRERSVCVIGAGFSGAATAVQLLEEHRGPDLLRVHLIERRGTVGEGAAYGTREPEHLLNVPARNMGLPAADPGHFLRWLQARDPAAGPATFAPRQLYGTYVRDTLDAAIRASAGRAAVTMHLDEARRVIRRPGGGWLVHMARGESIAADVVVLASGHRPPSDPLAGRWDGPRHRWIADPWRPHAVADIQPNEPVAIVGSGLSATDVLLSLTGERAPRRSAPIWMLTRRGLLPRVHHDPPQPAADLSAPAEPLLALHHLTALQLLRWLRGQLGTGQDWRQVIDGLRPHTSALWQRLPTPERARFIRHLQGFWEVHRHRTAASVGRHVERVLGDGSLQVVRCRVERAQASEDAVDLTVRAWRRGQPHQARVFRAAWVINCTGPAPSQQGDADPAVRSLIDSGLARPDPLGLGLDTSPEGELLDRGGRPQEDLLVVGTLRKPALWESTAVPELRGQAATAAQRALQALFAR
jgi:uncharacterized NAD(P)/FAD-binding protein YdhS/predicted metal-dependent enzyme (double-stranded beta helix superfamily)